MQINTKIQNSKLKKKKLKIFKKKSKIQIKWLKN